MEILLEKEDFLNGIKMVEKITSQKSVQPVLSNVLIETSTSDRITFVATDLSLTISNKVKAEVSKEGSITINAKKLGEIITKLEEKPIKLITEDETNKVSIECGRSKFELIGIGAENYPKVVQEENEESVKIEIDKNIFSKLIKQTIYTTGQNELSSSVLGGICITIKDNKIELAGTDGNRLTKTTKEIESNEDVQFIIPTRTLNEVVRISQSVSDKTIKLEINKNNIMFIFDNIKFSSKLIEGHYPKYQQLIPEKYENIIEIEREELINSIERVATVANDRTNIIKLSFLEDTLEIVSDAPEAGCGKDIIEIDYKKDDLTIAFNYRYLLDAIKNMESKEIKMEVSTPSAATIFTEKLEDEERERDYLCLVMPVQVR